MKFIKLFPGYVLFLYDLFYDVLKNLGHLILSFLLSPNIVSLMGNSVRLIIVVKYYSLLTSSSSLE